MLKNLMIAAAALAMLAGTGAQAAAAKGEKAAAAKGEKKAHAKHASTKHHCVKDGAEIKTTAASGGKEGRTIRRSKTCAKEGGKWELAEKPAAAAEKPAAEAK